MRIHHKQGHYCRAFNFAGGDKRVAQRRVVVDSEALSEPVHKHNYGSLNTSILQHFRDYGIMDEIHH